MRVCREGSSVVLRPAVRGDVQGARVDHVEGEVVQLPVRVQAGDPQQVERLVTCQRVLGDENTDFFGAWAPGAVANADLSFQSRLEAVKSPERVRGHDGQARSPDPGESPDTVVVPIFSPIARCPPR